MEKRKKKVYFCPHCKNRIPFDRHYVLVVCSICQEAMVVLEEDVA
jgi:transcription initiation factor IIE alpha subunit